MDEFLKDLTYGGIYRKTEEGVLKFRTLWGMNILILYIGKDESDNSFIINPTDSAAILECKDIALVGLPSGIDSDLIFFDTLAERDAYTLQTDRQPCYVYETFTFYWWDEELSQWNRLNLSNKTYITVEEIEEHVADDGIHVPAGGTTGQILSKISNADGDTTWKDDETGTDEKVKYNVDDPTAGYIADKFVQGDGISISEGIGADENKLVIENTDKGSDVVVPAPATNPPEDHGTAAVGTSVKYAREDHEHNSDNTDTIYEHPATHPQSIIDQSETATDTPIDASRFHFWDTVNSLWKAITWENIKVLLNTLYNQFNTLRGLNYEPHGFIDPDTDVTISFDDLNKTLTIEPVGAKFDAYSESELFTKTAAETIQIDDLNGNHYIYYDKDGLLHKTQTYNDNIIYRYCIVAVVYWNVAEQKHILLNHEYLHTTKMGGKTHAYLHLTRGFWIETGGGIGDLLVEENGALDTHIQFSNEYSVAWDEDARCELLARLSTDNISVYWKTGAEANPVWYVKEDASFPIFIESGNVLPSYNQLTGGSWQLTEMGNNNYFLIHVALNNDLDRRFMTFLGQQSYPNLVNVRANARLELDNLILEGMVSPEFRFIATMIVQVNNGYANTVKARFRRIDADTDYIDWREVTIGRGGVSGAVTDHQATANRDALNSHPYEAIGELREQTSVATGATITPTGNGKENQLFVTALASATVLAVPSGTPVNGNTLLVRIKDNGTVRDVTYNAIYNGDMPETTEVGEELYMEFIYNSTTSKWDFQVSGGGEEYEEFTLGNLGTGELNWENSIYQVGQAVADAEITFLPKSGEKARKYQLRIIPHATNYVTFTFTNAKISGRLKDDDKTNISVPPLTEIDMFIISFYNNGVDTIYYAIEANF